MTADQQFDRTLVHRHMEETLIFSSLLYLFQDFLFYSRLIWIVSTVIGLLVWTCLENRKYHHPVTLVLSLSDSVWNNQSSCRVFPYLTQFSSCRISHRGQIIQSCLVSLQFMLIAPTFYLNMNFLIFEGSVVWKCLKVLIFACEAGSSHLFIFRVEMM